MLFVVDVGDLRHMGAVLSNMAIEKQKAKVKGTHVCVYVCVCMCVECVWSVCGDV